MPTTDGLRPRRRLLQAIAVIVTLYVLFSMAIAWSTVDTCGDEDSPKHWNFFPPEWVCERGQLRT
jgi:hypothetical protein